MLEWGLHLQLEIVIFVHLNFLGPLVVMLNEELIFMLTS